MTSITSVSGKSIGRRLIGATAIVATAALLWYARPYISTVNNEIKSYKGVPKVAETLKEGDTKKAQVILEELEKQGLVSQEDGKLLHLEIDRTKKTAELEQRLKDKDYANASKTLTELEELGIKSQKIEEYRTKIHEFSESSLINRISWGGKGEISTACWDYMKNFPKGDNLPYVRRELVRDQLRILSDNFQSDSDYLEVYHRIKWINGFFEDARESLSKLQISPDTEKLVKEKYDLFLSKEGGKRPDDRVAIGTRVIAYPSAAGCKSKKNEYNIDRNNHLPATMPGTIIFVEENNTSILVRLDVADIGYSVSWQWDGMNFKEGDKINIAYFCSDELRIKATDLDKTLLREEGNKLFENLKNYVSSNENPSVKKTGAIK